MLHYLKLMLQLVMAPTRGWEDVAAGADTPRRTLLAGLLPLAAIAAATVYLGAFYELHPSFAKLTVAAVVTFLKYAVSYFVAVAILTYSLPRLTADGLVNRETVDLFAAYSLGIMAAIGILENLLPMELTLLQFLPIYVVVVICMGRKFLDVDSADIFRFTAVGILSVIVPVYLIDMLLMPAGF